LLLSAAASSHSRCQQTNLLAELFVYLGLSHSLESSVGWHFPHSLHAGVPRRLLDLWSARVQARSCRKSQPIWCPPWRTFLLSTPQRVRLNLSVTPLVELLFAAAASRLTPHDLQSAKSSWQPSSPPLSDKVLAGAPQRQKISRCTTPAVVVASLLEFGTASTCRVRCTRSPLGDTCSPWWTPAAL